MARGRRTGRADGSADGAELGLGGLGGTSSREASGAPLDTRRYLALSKTPTYGVLAALPLLLLYDVLIAFVNRGQRVSVRNGAEVLLGRALAAVGAPTALGLTAVLAVLGVLFVVREQRRAPVPLDRRVFGRMAAESAVLAILIGPVVRTATSIVLAPLPGPSLAIPTIGFPPLAMTAQPSNGPLAQIALSLGAGLYEELVFRVILVTAIAWAVRASGKTSARGALAVAVVTGAVLFSAAHYRPFNPAGETLLLTSFAYRFMAGLAFSALFAVRGFGVTAWTHALYDVWVVLR